MTRATELTFDGITQPITEWALDYGITRRLIASRLRWGWSVEKAITTPMSVKGGFCLPEKALLRPRTRRASRVPGPASGKRLHHAGRSLTVAEWAADLGIPDRTIRSRLTNGWSLDEALDTPKLVGIRPSKLRRYDHDGLSLTISEWSQRLGVSESRLYQRLRTSGSIAALPPAPRPKRGKRYEFDGVSLSLSEWSERLGVTVTALSSRLCAGHPTHVVFSSSSPRIYGTRMLTFNGETLSQSEWSRRTGIAVSTIYNRLHRGLTDEETLTRPVRGTRPTSTGATRAPGAPSELSTARAMTGGHPSTHALI